MHSINKTHLVVLMIIWLLIHVLLFWSFGIRSLFDANDYINEADFFVKHGRFADIYHIFYAVPIGTIAFFRWLFPGQIVPFLVFQCILSGIAMLALYRSALKIFGNALSGFLASLIFLLWWDNIHWNTTAMTESLACSATCILLFRLTCFKGMLKDYCWIAGLLIIIFFIRPTGVVIIVGTIAFLLCYHWQNINKHALKWPIVAGLLLIGYLSADVMFNHWDFTEQYKKGNIVTYMDGIVGSPLYEERLVLVPSHIKFADSTKSPMAKILLFIFYNPIYFLKAACLKIWYLLSAVRPYYSYLHNTYSILWLSLIYMIFYFGWLKAIMFPVKVFIIVVILVNCGLIAVATVDWDNRFYMPMEPGIVLLAGGGASYVTNFVKDGLGRWGVNLVGK